VLSTELDLADAAATEQLGRCLAQTLPAEPVVAALSGDLGAGKSTLARALLRALGVTGAVRSPTYTLVERYPTAVGECLHLDLYRIADPEELDFFGLDELREVARVWLVEWPSRGGNRLPATDLDIELMHAGEARRVRLKPLTENGKAWLDAASAVWHGARNS